MRRRGFESGHRREALVWCSCCLTIRHTTFAPMRAPTEGWSRQPAALPWRKCGFDSRWALFSAGRRKAWYSAGHRREALVAGARDRGFKSRRPDFNCGGACVGTGGRLLSVMSQVRFLPPQPGNGRASQLAMAAAPKAAER